jgi:hypothetical protein
MPILTNGYSLLSSGMVNETSSVLKFTLVCERRDMQTSQGHVRGLSVVAIQSNVTL